MSKTQNGEAKKNLKHVLIFVGILGGAVAGVFGWHALFPRSGNYQQLVGMRYAEVEGKGMLVTLLQEYSYDETYGNALEGYVLEMTVPGMGKAFASQFFPCERGYLPTEAVLRVGEHGRAWLMHKGEAGRKDATGFIQGVQLHADGKMEAVKVAGMEGLEVLDQRRQEGWIGLRNKYGELLCYHIGKDSLREGGCPEGMGKEGRWFFKYPKTNPSNRYKLWYYKLDAGWEPRGMEDFMGPMVGQTVRVEDLFWNPMGISEMQLKLKEVARDTAGYVLRQVYGKDYLVNPVLVYQDSVRSVWLHGEKSGEHTGKLLCVDEGGGQVWEVEAPVAVTTMPFKDYHCAWRAEEAVVMAEPYWALGVSLRTGAIVWSYVWEE